MVSKATLFQMLRDTFRYIFKSTILIKFLFTIPLSNKMNRTKKSDIFGKAELKTTISYQFPTAVPFTQGVVIRRSHILQFFRNLDLSNCEIRCHLVRGITFQGW